MAHQSLKLFLTFCVVMTVNTFVDIAQSSALFFILHPIHHHHLHRPPRSRFLVIPANIFITNLRLAWPPVVQSQSRRWITNQINHDRFRNQHFPLMANTFAWRRPTHETLIVTSNSARRRVNAFVDVEQSNRQPNSLMLMKTAPPYSSSSPNTHS